jgi:protein SCO1/2
MKLSFKDIALLVGVGLLALLVAAFAYQQYRVRSSPTYAGTALTTPVTIPPFELTAADGDRVTLGRWRGDVRLIFFGYTRCPDVCPLTLGRLAKVYEDIGRPQDLKVVMITVDPQNDTPQLTQDYARSFDPDFIGLGGSSSDIAQAAQTFFVGYRGIDSKDFIHTDSVALLDREGRMRLIYGQDKVARLSEDLPQILASRDF